MVERGKKRSSRRWWVRTALAAGGLGAAVAAFSFARQPAQPARTVQAAPGGEAASPVAPPADSDYTTKPVAFIGGYITITREELGEFLILRRGAVKVDMLVDQRIVEMACHEAGVEVTAGEVDASFADDLKDLGGITPADFVKQVLGRYSKNLIEWKEDVVRLKLMLGKLCRARIHLSEEDLSTAFEASYGEKIDCRLIQWSKDKEKEAKAVYPKIRDSEQAFSEEAKRQETSALAATGGKIKPINHHLTKYNTAFSRQEDNELLEKEAFRLQPGEVSSLLNVGDGFVVVKCDRRLPADTTLNPAAVRADLIKELTERKVLEEIPKLMHELRDRAHPVAIKKNDEPALPPVFTPGVSKGRVVAYVYGNVPVTREELGEFLIKRYGAENLELLVNRRIIDEECKAKGITVEPVDIDAAWVAKQASAGGPDAFNKALVNNRILPYQYKEDVLRPQIQLTRLAANLVKVTDEDLKAAYEAYYGEKIKCRLIIWPKKERKNAMAEYGKLRDSEDEFSQKAGRQINPELSKNQGYLLDDKKEVRLIGRHTLGNPELERELFSLQPGEVSKLVETPEGIVVMKCDARVPPNGSVSLDSVRDRLAAEVRERKTQIEMPLLFAKLREQAAPRLLLKDPTRAVDLTAEVKRDLNSNIPLPKHQGKVPAGN